MLWFLQRKWKNRIGHSSNAVPLAGAGNAHMKPEKPAGAGRLASLLTFPLFIKLCFNHQKPQIDHQDTLEKLFSVLLKSH